MVNKLLLKKIFFFTTITLILTFLPLGKFVNGSEITNQLEKKTLIEKMFKVWESQKKDRIATLSYSFSLQQNIIYMSSRYLSEGVEVAKTDQNLTYFFKRGIKNHEELKNRKTFSSDYNNWYFDTYKNGKLSEFIFNNSKINAVEKTTQIKLSFLNGKLIPGDGVVIFIVDSLSLKLLGTLEKVDYHNTTGISLTYTRDLSTDELAFFKKKSRFKSGFKNIKSPKEMRGFVLELVNETPRLAEDCPWLLGKGKIPN